MPKYKVSLEVRCIPLEVTVDAADIASAVQFFKDRPVGTREVSYTLSNHNELAHGEEVRIRSTKFVRQEFAVTGALEVTEPEFDSRLRRKTVKANWGVEGKDLWTRNGNLAYTVYFRYCDGESYSHMCVNADTPEEAKAWVEQVLAEEHIDGEILYVSEGDCEEVLL
ncbi:MAG: hypothetical protein IT165_06550 [Bryobacterales bacterium]|nr:hypothetical protein [Bryobacterales bacterium]